MAGQRVAALQAAPHLAGRECKPPAPGCTIAREFWSLLNLITSETSGRTQPGHRTAFAHTLARNSSNWQAFAAQDSRHAPHLPEH